MALSKAQLKYYRSLKLKKFREIDRLFSVEGDKLCKEILMNKHIKIKSILALPHWIENNEDLIQNYPSKLHSINDKELKSISNFSSPNQAYIVCEKPNFKVNHNYIHKNISIYLDNIQDPGNMGTILRTADWFGIQYIFCSKGCVEWSNPKVIQSTMGAFLRVKIIEMTFLDFCKKFPNVPTFAATLDGKNLFQEKYEGKGLIIIGNESKGISKEIIKKTNHRIAIPKGQNGGAESLNAGVATGIICSYFSQFQSVN